MALRSRHLPWLLLFLVPALLLCVSAGPMEQDGTIRPFPGCEITRRTLRQPRANVVYIVRLDPKAVQFVATPGNGDAPEETTLQTTRAFLEEHELDLAFNTSFARIPKVGGLSAPFADLCGAAVSDGQIISQPEANFPAVEIDEDNRLRVLGPKHGLAGRKHVVAGNSVIVENGRNTQRAQTPDKFHPRTALGVTGDGTLLVMIVDGRQPGRSEGVTQMELAELLVAEGATLAVNLDGGGSTTLVIRDEQQGEQVNEKRKGRILNVPVGIANQPGSERPVGFNLGVVARPTAASGPTSQPS